MAACTNCGWVTVEELVRGGMCLVCSTYLRHFGVERPPPEDLEHLHRGETWPCASDPRVRALVACGERLLGHV